MGNLGYRWEHQENKFRKEIILEVEQPEEAQERGKELEEFAMDKIKEAIRSIRSGKAGEDKIEPKIMRMRRGKEGQEKNG